MERVALCGGAAVHLCGARWKGLPCVVVQQCILWGKVKRVALCGGVVQQCIFVGQGRKCVFVGQGRKGCLVWFGAAVHIVGQGGKERVAQTSSGEVVPVLVGLHPQKLEKLAPMNMVLYLNSV